MILIIGFKFNTSILVIYYTAERYSLDYSFFLEGNMEGRAFKFAEWTRTLLDKVKLKILPKRFRSKKNEKGKLMSFSRGEHCIFNKIDYPLLTSVLYIIIFIYLL